jgi:hypothetical protein
MTLEDLLPPPAEPLAELQIKDQTAYGEGTVDVEAKLKDYGVHWKNLRTQAGAIESFQLYVAEAASKQVIDQYTGICDRQDNQVSPSGVIPAEAYQELLSAHMNAVEVLQHLWKSKNGGDLSETRLRRFILVLDQIENRINSIISSLVGDEHLAAKAVFYILYLEITYLCV